jgi:hypothetical protein
VERDLLPGAGGKGSYWEQRDLLPVVGLR